MERNGRTILEPAMTLGGILYFAAYFGAFLTLLAWYLYIQFRG